MSVDWQAVRAGFPALRNRTFLNTATFGQLPAAAVAALNRHLTDRDRTACADFLGWFDDADRVRGLIARLINASPEDIAFVPAANTALSLFLGGIEWRAGDEILTLTDEFPNQVYYPQWLSRHGVRLIEVPWERFYDSISPATRAVVLSTASYSTGFRPPVEEIRRHLDDRPVRLFLDSTQTLGAIRFDAQAVAPDLFACHGYKWLLCPTGAAFLYAPPITREWLEPSVFGWRSHRDWRNVNALHQGLPELPESAERYEGGMLPFPLLYAMEASIQLMLEIGPERIEQRVLALARSLHQALEGLGAEFPTPAVPGYESPIVCARFPGRDAAELVRLLREREVLVAARHGALRVSVHFYNGEEDIRTLESALSTIL